MVLPATRYLTSRFIDGARLVIRGLGSFCHATHPTLAPAFGWRLVGPLGSFCQMDGAWYCQMVGALASYCQMDGALGSFCQAGVGRLVMSK